MWSKKFTLTSLLLFALRSLEENWKPATIMPTAEQNILSALFALSEVHGDDEPDKMQVATMASVSQATFAPLLSRMVNKKGLVEYASKDTIKLTKKGKEEAAELASPGDMITTNEQHHEQIKEKLKGKKAVQIFEYLADGKEHEKQDIMEAVKCTNPKTFAPLLSRELKKPGYIVYPSKTTVQLSDLCFPFGRP